MMTVMVAWEIQGVWNGKQRFKVVDGFIELRIHHGADHYGHHLDHRAVAAVQVNQSKSTLGCAADFAGNYNQVSAFAIRHGLFKTT